MPSPSSPLASSPTPPPPSGTGTGTTSSACSRPRSPLAPTSPLCYKRAPPPAACFRTAPRRHSPSPPRRLLPSTMPGSLTQLPTLLILNSIIMHLHSQSCLAMRYEALLLRDAKFSDSHHLKVSREEWLTFAKDALHNGFYTIASKAFAHATAHTHRSHPRQFDSTDSIDKDMINDITGLQTLAESLSAKHSDQTESAEYMKRRKSGVHEKYNLQSGKPKLPGTSMYMLGIKTRNIKKLLHSRERNLGDILKQS
ncbi:hypothetical protein PVAP13_8KG176750 [Panicum virgatum]|uniref:Uncharacterized protein n=1 Tax=Panicum virgatum TaxID=38727 RepID=A0A8T0PEU0_PANVG|nr:hypothetical protein PVAP13_8KG176750 [Panicum virgatum]